jgi:hypothetical protein
MIEECHRELAWPFQSKPRHVGTTASSVSSEAVFVAAVSISGELWFRSRSLRASSENKEGKAPNQVNLRFPQDSPSWPHLSGGIAVTFSFAKQLPGNLPPTHGENALTTRCNAVQMPNQMFLRSMASGDDVKWR